MTVYPGTSLRRTFNSFPNRQSAVGRRSSKRYKALEPVWITPPLILRVGALSGQVGAGFPFYVAKPTSIKVWQFVRKTRHETKEVSASETLI